MTAPDRHNRTSQEDADALDQWLESECHIDRRADTRACPERSVGSAALRGRSDNGIADTSLRSVAQRAHAAIAIAEKQVQPEIPVDAIWEKVMASATTTNVDTLRAVERSQRFLVPRNDNRSGQHIPAFLSGSHWAVSAVLIAALVVGILALYGSFAGSPGGDDDPATNPGLAFGTPGATSAVDSSANLAPIGPDECDVEPRSLEEVSELLSDPGETIPREYQPVTSIGPDVGLQISEANRTWRSCTLFGLPGDYRAMESPQFIFEIGGNRLSGLFSQDEVNAAYETWRYLSDAALSPDWRTYYIESATFGQEVESILPGETTRPVAEMGSVMLPEQMVQLPDGRIGGPVSIVHAPFAAGFDPLVGLDYLEVPFTIYTQDPTQNGAWVIDEVLQLCAGECDAYWQTQAQVFGYDTGTPMATPSAPATGLATPPVDSSLLPITAEECDVEPRTEAEIAALVEDPGELPPRAYDVAPIIDRALAGQLVETDRAWQSCVQFGSDQEQAALESPRLLGEDPMSPAFPGQELERLAQHDATRDLATAVSTGNWSDYYVDASLLYGPNYVNSPRAVPLPEQAVALTDGRVAMPLAEFTVFDGPGSYASSLSSPSVTIPVDILIQDPTQDGQWVVDEQILLCLGNCGSFRQILVQAIYERGLSPSASTPEASPVATPSTDAAWLQPISPDECDVEPRALEEVAALMQDPGEFPPREYGPAQPVSEEEALEIASANRAFQSCSLTGDTEEWRAMVSPRLIFEGQGSPYFDTITHRSATYEEYVTNHRELSEMLLTDPTKDYTVESTQAALVREDGLADYSASEIWWTVMLPDDMVMLPDGRIGGPELTLLPANHEAIRQAEVDFGVPTVTLLSRTVSCEPRITPLILAAMERQGRTATLRVVVEQGGPAQAQHAQIAAISPVEAAALAAADHPQAQLRAPPQRQVQHEQQPVEADQLGDFAALDIKAPALAILIGGLAAHAAPVLPHPRRSRWPVREEDPGFGGGLGPVNRQLHGAPAGLLAHLDAARPALAPPSDQLPHRSVHRPRSPHAIGVGRPGIEAQHIVPADLGAEVDHLHPRDAPVAEQGHRAVRWHRRRHLAQHRRQVGILGRRPGTVLLRHHAPGDRQHPPVVDDAQDQDRGMVVLGRRVEDHDHLLSGFACQQHREQRRPHLADDHGGVGKPAPQPSLQASIAGQQRETGGHRGQTDGPGPEQTQHHQGQVGHAGGPDLRQQRAELALPGMQQLATGVHAGSPSRIGSIRHRPVSHGASRMHPHPPCLLPVSPNCPGEKTVTPYEYEPVIYRIYSQDPTQDGRWVLDETLPLCASNCDAYYAVSEAYYQSQVPLFPVVPEATPIATPADPNAHWLQDPELNSCAENETDPFPATPDFNRPGAVEDYLPFAEASETQQLAVASQHLLIQANCAPNESGMPTVSDDFGIMPAPDSEGVTQQQLGTAMAIAEAVSAGDPLQHIIEGDALPDSASTGGPMASRRYVLLPEDVVRLPDGRLGAPLTAFMQTNHPSGVAGWIGDSGGYLELLFVIYEEQDGVWAYDEVISICIGECDDYWGSTGSNPTAHRRQLRFPRRGRSHRHANRRGGPPADTTCGQPHARGGPPDSPGVGRADNPA